MANQTHRQSSSLSERNFRSNDPKTLKLEENTWALHTTPRRDAEQHEFGTDTRMNRTTKRKIRRNRIFQTLPKKFEHFEIGMRVSNLNFDQLDRSLLPRIFYSSKCGCESSLRPCQRLTKELSQLSLKEMKDRYQIMKDTGKYQQPYMGVKQGVLLLPPLYPEPLKSVFQNVLQFIQFDQVTVPMLSCIVWHAKCEYLSYFIYTELVRSTFDHANVGEEVEILIDSHSSDLSSLLTDDSLKEIAHFAQQFCRTGGCNIVPMNEYAKYIDCLNRTGKTYPAKVIFSLMLQLKPEIESRAGNLKPFMQKELRLKKDSIPWGLVFEAACNNLIK